MSWQQRAACGKDYVESDWFYPKDGAVWSDGRTNQFYDDDGLRARLICSGCPVRQQCWEQNRGDKTGIFAGLTHDQRFRLRKQTLTDSGGFFDTGRHFDWTWIKLPKLHRPARPSGRLLRGLYAFQHGHTMEQAAALAEVPAKLLRRAVNERVLVTPGTVEQRAA